MPAFDATMVAASSAKLPNRVSSRMSTAMPKRSSMNRSTRPMSSGTCATNSGTRPASSCTCSIMVGMTATITTETSVINVM